MAKRGMPSMLALLGLLAFAGYQNRDKISEMLKKAGAGSADPNRPPGSAPSGLEGVLAGLGDMIGGKGGNGGNSGTLSGGLGDLVDRFKQTGQAETADSWVKPGPNRGLTGSWDCGPAREGQPACRHASLGRRERSMSTWSDGEDVEACDSIICSQERNPTMVGLSRLVSGVSRQ